MTRRPFVLAPALLAAACHSATLLAADGGLPATVSAVAPTRALVPAQAGGQSAPRLSEQARDWAAACAGCHGPAGRAPKGSVIPGLAGRPAAGLIARMQAFKAGTREGTVMRQIALGYSDDQIATMARWFAAVR